MVGLRNLGKELQAVLKKPWRAVLLWRSPPRIPVQHSILQKPAGVLAKQIARFARACTRRVVHYREGIIDHEFVKRGSATRPRSSSTRAASTPASPDS